MSRQMEQVQITTDQTRRAAEVVGASPPNGMFEAPGSQLASKGEEKMEDEAKTDIWHKLCKHMFDYIVLVIIVSASFQNP